MAKKKKEEFDYSREAAAKLLTDLFEKNKVDEIATEGKAILNNFAKGAPHYACKSVSMAVYFEIKYNYKRNGKFLSL